MSEDRAKRLRLLRYWFFSTVMIVFAALTTYITIWVRPAGASIMDVIWAGFPIWGGVALAAIVLYVGYYFYSQRK